MSIIAALSPKTVGGGLALVPLTSSFHVPLWESRPPAC